MKVMKDISVVDRFIQQNHLEASADAVQALLQESIRLIPASLGMVSDALVRLREGTSHLGGQPDVPEGFTWPVYKGAPMSFVGQVRLEEMASFKAARELPDAGLLSFFYDSQQSVYGDHSADRGGWQVCYTEPQFALHRAEFPTELAESGRFAPYAVRFHTEWTLPVSAQQINPLLLWSKEVVQRYEQMLSASYSQAERQVPHHRIFGWPDQIQDDMQLQSALNAHSIDQDDNAAIAAAEKSKSDWRLLLQVDSDASHGFRWGSAGMIYFWMEKQALAERRFEETWFVLQSD